jgi:hypothetical protein
MAQTKVTDDLIDDVAASKITGALPAISGASLTSLNASNLGSGTVPTARLGSGTASSSTFLRGDSTYAEAGGGKVLQIISTAKSDTFGSTSPVTPADVTGMSVTITPSATSSKVWLTVSVAYSGSTDNDTYFRIVRGSTAIAIGDAAGSRDRCWFELPRSHSTGNVMSGVACLAFLDSPSTTSATTYKLQVGGTSDTAQMYVNRGVGDGDYSGNGRGFSSITAMEIGA